MPGSLVIISSPSGGGKDSVINALIKRIPRSVRIITTTTRPPRPGNKNGVDYFFITENEFKQKLTNKDFIEHNFYAGNYYGTDRVEVNRCLTNFDVIFTQIDVNGKHNFDKAGIKNLAIFLVPENLDILKKRIEKRGGITPEVIAERLKVAETEIAAAVDYDYRITNVDGKFTETVDTIAKIIEKHHSDDQTIDKN